MASTSSSVSFDRFIDLPTELRLQIWQFTFPGHGPRLCTLRDVDDLWSSWTDRMNRSQAHRSTLEPAFVAEHMQITYPYPLTAFSNDESWSEFLFYATNKHSGDSSIEDDVVVRAVNEHDILYFRCGDIEQLGGLSVYVSDMNLSREPDDQIGVFRLAVDEDTLLWCSEDEEKERKDMGPEDRTGAAQSREVLDFPGVLYVVRRLCNDENDEDDELAGCWEIKDGVSRVWTWNADTDIVEFTSDADVPGGSVGESQDSRRNERLRNAIQGLARFERKSWVKKFEIREVEVVCDV